MQARIADAERSANAADEALAQAEKSLATLEPDAAAEQLGAARERLAERDMRHYPEYEMLSKRLAEAEKRLPYVKKEREKRDLAHAVVQQRQKLNAALGRWRVALEGIERRNISRPAVEDAEESAAQLGAVVEGGKQLESKDAKYAAYAAKCRQAAARTGPKVALAQARVDFIEGPLASRVEGEKLLRAAQSDKDFKSRSKKMEKAQDKFGECAQKGDALLAQQPLLARAQLSANGTASTPQAVTRACQTASKELDRRLAALKSKKPKKAQP